MMNLPDIKQTLNTQNIKLIHVVAIDRANCIGKDNQLAWHIPEDLQHFKAITDGGVIVMGRKTFESIGRALPNRINWVISKDKNWTADGVKVANSLEQAIEHACIDVKKSQQPTCLFIIGGGEIFKQTLELADRLEVSHIELEVQGDTFYPAITPDFCAVDTKQGVSSEGIAYRFVRYVRS